MADLTSAQYTVSAAQKLGTPGMNRHLLMVSNPAGGAVVYIGASDVSATKYGYILNPSAAVPANLILQNQPGAPAASMEWYAFCATSQAISIIEGT